MAAGVIYQTVTTTSGETVELAFYVDDTVTPTTWIPVRLNTNAAGSPVAFGSGAAGVTVPRMLLATDDPAVAQLNKLIFTATRLLVRGEPRIFAVAGTAMTKVSGVTAYAANNSVSNHATAGSVTANSVTLSDTNDDPITIERFRIDTTDTGVVGKNVRVWLYNSDPTASSGVVNGDHAAFSNKKAGCIGTMLGLAKTGLSDGALIVCTPEDGARIVTAPGSGAKTIWWQLQTLDAFTPVSSSTWTPTVEGYQGRV